MSLSIRSFFYSIHPSIHSFHYFPPLFVLSAVEETKTQDTAGEQTEGTKQFVSNIACVYFHAFLIQIKSGQSDVLGVSDIYVGLAVVPISR